jgi:hypothetical protein
MRLYVQRTITLQGRGKKYQPLAQITSLRTGRRKALLSLRKQIKSNFTSKNANVFFTPISDKWNDLSHHFGFTSPPVVNKRMVIPLRGGGSIFLKNRKASVIPAREIWPSNKEVTTEVKPIFDRFIRNTMRRNWR